MSRITLERDSSSGCVRLYSLEKEPTSLLSSMYENDKNLCDVKLPGAAVAGGTCDLQPIRAHKNILAHASPHLRDLFTAQGYVDSNKPAYIFTNINHDSLCNIVRFIYTDNVEMEEADAVERVRGILIGAKYLVIKKLADGCETFLASSDRIDVRNCIDVFQFAFKYNYSYLLSAVCAFIAENLLPVSQSVKFLSLKQNECAKFLLSEPVAAANADDRCQAAIAWLNHESPSRAESAECIMSMAKLDGVGVKPETLLLAAESAVIRPTIKGFALTLVDAMASSIQRTSRQRESNRKKQKLEKARDVEAWYVVGSYDDGKVFYRYNVARREWLTLPKLPWERRNGGACAVGKRLIYMGGHKRGRLTTAIDEYDTVTQTWSVSNAKLRHTREDVAVAADSTYAYAFGGQHGLLFEGCSFETAERYSVKPQKLEMLPDMDDKRFEAAAVCKDDGDTVFVVGGFAKCACSGQVACDAVVKYDRASKEWSEIAVVKETRASAGVAFLGDDLYIAGGCASLTVEILNTETGCIRACSAKLGRVRDGCSAVRLDPYVLCVVGGCASEAGADHSFVEALDVREGKWTVGNIVPDMPKACAYFGFAHVRS